MERNKLIWFGVFVGGALGGYIPALWGDSVFSIASIFGSAIGGFLGIWIMWKISG